MGSADEPQAPKDRHDAAVKMMMIQFLLGVAVVCALLLAAIFLWQDRLLYFPDRASAERMASATLRPWPSASADFRGLVAEPAGAVRGTAIVFHGNAGHAGHRSFYVGALAPMGWRVVLAEYPGYGPRPGPVGEASLVDDAAATVALAHRQFGAPLLVIGESLGAAVAAAAAAKQRDLSAGLLLITPWDKLESAASHHYPWLPVRWMLRDDYDTRDKLARFDRPVVIAVAEQDRIVPAALGTALHAALPGPKHLLSIARSGHNDWPGLVDAAWWRDAVALAMGETH
jgi:hypothetical protein